jgi:hypothetical protein
MPQIDKGLLALATLIIALDLDYFGERTPRGGALAFRLLRTMLRESAVDALLRSFAISITRGDPIVRPKLRTSRRARSALS